MRRIIYGLMFIAFLAEAGYEIHKHHARLRAAARLLMWKASPCAAPVTYSIGYIDPRFVVAENAFAEDLKAAEAVWEEPSRRNLFEYSPAGGDIAVNFVYDSRQAALDRLKTLGIRTDYSRASYEALKARYNALSARVNSEQALNSASLAAYRWREAAFNSRVRRWNGNSGGPPAELRRLEAEKAALARKFADVKSRENSVNGDIDTLNALATTLNQLIVQLNLNAAQYNRSGASLGVHEAGLYRASWGIRTIDIYEYTGRARLERLLAHELGHALGLDHVSAPQAIMHRTILGEKLQASGADVSELNRACSRGFLKYH